MAHFCLRFLIVALVFTCSSARSNRHHTSQADSLRVGDHIGCSDTEGSLSALDVSPEEIARILACKDDDCNCILQIDGTADKKKVKTQYLKKSKSVHPDKNPENNANATKAQQLLQRCSGDKRQWVPVGDFDCSLFSVERCPKSECSVLDGRCVSHTSMARMTTGTSTVAPSETTAAPPASPLKSAAATPSASVAVLLGCALVLLADPTFAELR
mmetsp:Transcript_109857/g.276379  ORF Transcript_109857/g.276379 Transcript_109857/m.276379 type:complete len:214 (-) Transcript_109857:78-719(-)